VEIRHGTKVNGGWEREEKSSRFLLPPWAPYKAWAVVRHDGGRHEGVTTARHPTSPHNRLTFDGNLAGFFSSRTPLERGVSRVPGSEPSLVSDPAAAFLSKAQPDASQRFYGCSETSDWRLAGRMGRPLAGEKIECF
jgi:hypothetical protein